MGLGLDKQQKYCSDLSTGLLSMTGDPETLITDNMDGTIDINHGGQFRIVDRTDTFNFLSRARRNSFIATNNIDHTASGTDGNKVIIVDMSGTITIEALASGSAKLLAFEGVGVPNFNTHVQIGSISKDSGTINSFLTVISVNNNINNKLRFATDTIGVVNSVNDPQDIVISGNNDLKLNYTKGSSILTDIGFVDTDGLSPDQDILAADVTDVPILSVTRDGIIQAIGTDLNVLDIESPIGTLTPMGNNRSANRYVLGFADEQFIAVLFGQADFSTIDVAAIAPETLDNIALTQFGVKLRKISVEKSETDNANFVLTLLKQFR